ncbi:MAG: dihydropteroate synthase [Burkholderiaceae bacterium]
MGIVNLTPDSFSDGGRFDRIDDAIRHAQRLIDEGADLIDVGAESTRPGAVTVSIDEEVERLSPFLHAMRDAPVPISVDTRKPAVMRAAIDAGAAMINDIAGFASAAARDAVVCADCALCVMHMQGDPQTMQRDPIYEDVLVEVATFLAERVAALTEAGAARDRIVVDPGFGFGKTFEHNLTMLRGFDAFVDLGWPVLAGLSRKGMIGTITGRPVGDRVAGSVAAALVAIERGATIVRVHDVAATVDAIRVWMATHRSRL